MGTASDYETPETRTKRTLQRGNFYYAMGFTLLAGLVVVVGLGVLGITSLGVFTVSTAMAMTAIAITLLGVVSFVTLTTLRRTLGILSHHETAFAEQQEQHAELAAQVQSQWREAQAVRDRNQDADVAALSARQDAYFVEEQGLAERSRVSGAVRRPLPAADDRFHGGKIRPVRDVEGIGDHYGNLLDDMGIKDTRQLWNADATDVAAALEIMPTEVEGWQSMAELMAVDGIGKQYAELLVRSGVYGIDELGAETLQPLLDRIERLERHQGNRIQGNTIGIKIVESWIRAAQAHHSKAPAVATVGGSNGPGA